MNDLNRFAISGDKDGAQNLVAAHNFGQAVFKCARIERTVQTKGRRNVVSDTARFQLIQKPETLLGKRERWIAYFFPGENRLGWRTG